uniref:Uncharacterized protein n=1 Tax=Oryza punctata TaxID=4537 RepID=A0A0E0LVI3_ORYPU
MGLLDQLWDETVAGPRPDSGLGKLRNSSVPSSPASAPDSPFASATTPKGDSWRRFRRKPKTAADAVPEAAAAVGPRSPTVYDWVVISSLDR